MDKHLEIMLMLETLRTQARGVVRGVTILEDINVDSFYHVIDQTEALLREYKVKEDRRDDTRRFL